MNVSSNESTDQERADSLCRQLRIVIEAVLYDKRLPEHMRGSPAILSRSVFELLQAMTTPDNPALITFIDDFLERLDTPDLESLEKH